MSSPLKAEDLKTFCVAAMVDAGLTQEDAELSAEVFVKTDTWGTFTHGTRQIRGLMKNARRGRLVAQARHLPSSTPATACRRPSPTAPWSWH